MLPEYFDRLQRDEYYVSEHGNKYHLAVDRRRTYCGIHSKYIIASVLIAVVMPHMRNERCKTCVKLDKQRRANSAKS